MRQITVLTFVLLLSGCSHFIEHKMATHTGLRAMDLHFDEPLYFSTYCSEHSAEACIDLIDWSVQRERVDELNLSFKLHYQGESIHSEQRFTVPLDSDRAPIMLLFPGYGMPAIGVGFMAEYFRAKGFRPLVLAAPTEQVPFSFGTRPLATVVEMLSQQYADRAVYAYGFSMGSLAVAELARSYDLDGAIVAAPMFDFDDSADTLINMYRRDQRFARLIPRASYTTAVQRMVASSGVGRQQLGWHYAVSQLPDNTLVLASSADSLSRFSDVAQEVTAQQREFALKELDNPVMIHPFMVVPVTEMTAIIDDWINAQSQSFYQYQSPTHEPAPEYGQ